MGSEMCIRDRNTGYTPLIREDPEGEDSCSTAKSDDDLEEEVVEEGLVVGEVTERDLKMPDEDIAAPVNYDAEDKNDGDKAADFARQIKVEFDPNDIRFWFAQLEDEMEVATIGKQWLKKTVLQRNLPVKQKEDVKALLTLAKTDAGNHIYLDIKNELLRIYAPKPCDSYRKALTRTMTGLPSQLGYQLVDDICKMPVKLQGCCCAAGAFALWSLQLPVNIRAHISNQEFTRETYKAVFEAADKVFLSSKQINVAALSLDETQSALRGPRHSSNPPESCCDRHQGCYEPHHHRAFQTSGLKPQFPLNYGFKPNQTVMK